MDPVGTPVISFLDKGLDLQSECTAAWEKMGEELSEKIWRSMALLWEWKEIICLYSCVLLIPPFIWNSKHDPVSKDNTRYYYVSGEAYVLL